jgi:class 3 adenylate cyclase
MHRVASKDVISMIKMRQHGNPASHADAERRQITVLFVDLVNSSHLAETLDPEDYSEIIVEYRQAAAAVIEAHGGFVARYLGDSISAYWGYPRARPQDPRRAIAAGRALIETITRSNRDDPTKTQIRIRIGVETGIVVVGQLGPSVAGAADIAGEAPVIAARLQALAEPNTVLITGNVRRLVERYFELSSWGTHELKGISAPVQAFKVIGERAVQDAGGFRSDRLYGREVEQDCLFSVWRDTLAGGGGTTLIAGEPGIGKTALVGHLRQIAVETGGVCFSSNCLEEGKHAPLRPVRDLLRQMTGVATLDDPAKTRRMLEAAAESDGLDRDAVQQLLLPLLEPPPSDVTLASLADRQQRMMACLIGWCQTIAARRPVLIVIEDIHWADGATLDFIASFASSSISTRLSLVVTSRTAFEIHWAEQSKLRLIVLERLNDDAIEALVERMAQDDSVDPLTRSAIVTRAEGNPLYAEELVLLAIRAQSEGRAADVLSLPSSLNESLLARLDDLGELRSIAQTAAVLGRDFDERILSDGLELSVADLAPKLSLLVAEGILVKQSAPWASHSFKHSLIRDAAYGSLLKARRGALHAKYAEILVSNHPLLARMNPEIIAQHYEQAGLFGQAISWWKFAGEHASRQS